MDLKFNQRVGNRTGTILTLEGLEEVNAIDVAANAEVDHVAANYKGPREWQFLDIPIKRVAAQVVAVKRARMYAPAEVEVSFDIDESREAIRALKHLEEDGVARDWAAIMYGKDNARRAQDTASDLNRQIEAACAENVAPVATPEYIDWNEYLGHS